MFMGVSIPKVLDMQDGLLITVQVLKSIVATIGRSCLRSIIMNKSKAKGTRAETNLVKYLESAGLEAFRQALHGSLDQGDVLLRMYDGNICTEEIVFEVKTGKQTASVSRKVKEEWLKQTRTEMHNAKVRKAYLVIAKWQTGINDWEVWSADGHSFWYLNHFVNYIKTHGKKVRRSEEHQDLSGHPGSTSR